MAIEFVCPNCNGTLQVADDAAGRVIRCGGCLTMLRVPGANSASSANTVAPSNPFETESPFPSSPRRSRSSSKDAESLPPERRRRDDDYEDQYDEPRRSRREPPPSPGRSAFVPLMVICTALSVAVISCCGGLFLLAPRENWRTHESAKGGFQVKLPAKTRANIENDVGIALEKGTFAEGTSLQRQWFMVIYRDIPSTKDRADRNRTDEDEINELVAKLLAATEMSSKSGDKPIMVGGFPGRELEYFGKSRRRYTARVIVADTRCYIVLACGPRTQGSSNVQQFLESFEITDKQLVDEGKEREKQAVGGKKEQEE